MSGFACVRIDELRNIESVIVFRIFIYLFIIIDAVKWILDSLCMNACKNKCVFVIFKISCKYNINNKEFW